MKLRESGRVGIRGLGAKGSAFAVCLALLVEGGMARAAEEGAVETAAPATTHDSSPRLGGHVGVALPYLQIGPQTSFVGQHDFLTIANPLGLTAKLRDGWAFDFEVILTTPVLTRSRTGLIIDPGVVRNWGPVATGLRVAYQVGEPSNFGVIPLVNRGFHVGSVTWFIEAAFPTFVKQGEVSLNAVAHTGIAF